jgi:hypothetical protein
MADNPAFLRRIDLYDAKRADEWNASFSLQELVFLDKFG